MTATPCALRPAFQKRGKGELERYAQGRGRGLHQVYPAGLFAGWLSQGTATVQTLRPTPKATSQKLTLGFKLSAPVTEVTLGGGLSIDEIVGTYDIVRSNDDGDTDEGQCVFSKNENGQLIEDNNIYSYNQATGTATFNFENNIGSTTATLVFTSENGRIHVSGSAALITERGTAKFYYDGYKVD